jgi:hypothetical protein
MNSRSLLGWVGVIALSVGLTHCVTPADDPVPTVLSEAIDLTEQGRIAFEARAFKDAELCYARALNIHRSIDNHTGIIRNLQNLAVVQKADGRRSAALESLDALDRYLSLQEQSSGSQIQDSETLDVVGEAGWLRARMYLDDGKDEQAQLALTEAIRKPGQSKNPRLQNLQARLYLAQGNPSGAQSAAAIAWSGSRGSKAHAEAADAARYQGRATEMLGQHSAAQGWYQKALALDQKLARSGLVADDLLGLARSSLLMQKPDQAAAYAVRALHTAQAAKDSVREKEAQNWMASALKAPPPAL